MKKSNKQGNDYIKLRHFDKWLLDVENLWELDKETQAYYLKYFKEEINGYYVKDIKDSIFYNEDFLKNKLKEIKENPELKKNFEEIKQEFKDKMLKNVSDLPKQINKLKRSKNIKDKKRAKMLENRLKKYQRYLDKGLPNKEFVVILCQRQANQKVKQRKEDAYGKMNDRTMSNIDLKFITPDSRSDFEINQEEDNLGYELYESEKLKADHEDVAFFKQCIKHERIDFFIYYKLLDICRNENNEEFKLMAQDLKPLNEEFEKKMFSRAKYLIYLYSCTVMSKNFSKNPANKSTIKELANIFNLIIYPTTKKRKRLMPELII